MSPPLCAAYFSLPVWHQGAPSCLVQLLCRTIPIQDEKDMAMRLILNLLIFLDGHYATRARFSLYSRWVVLADYWHCPSDCTVH